MSIPRNPDPAKLFLAAIYADAEVLDHCLRRLGEQLGPIDTGTRETPFESTGYYYLEMGDGLCRRFFTFRKLVDPGGLAEIKLATNALEQETAIGGRRRVNLDPGLISYYNLILASGKPGGQRPYLGKGIYADPTLSYDHGTFKAMPWTYPEYATPRMISFLNRLRQAYKREARSWKLEEGR